MVGSYANVTLYVFPDINAGGVISPIGATGAVVDGVFFHNGKDGLPVPDYVDENVSTKVVKIIQSYTGVVNKMVWRKE